MGAGGSSHYKTHAESEAARVKREQCAREKLKRKQDEEAKKKALNAEREAWLRNYKARGLEKKWWHVGWWPLYAWWKEKVAWEDELHRRRKEGLLDSEGLPLRSHHD